MMIGMKLVQFFFIYAILCESYNITVSESHGSHSEMFKMHRGKYPVMFKGLTRTSWPHLKHFITLYGQYKVKVLRHNPACLCA